MKTEELNSITNRVEGKWLLKLYEYIKTEFSRTWLPSHDHTHHLRVWLYARHLFEILQQRGHHFSEMKVEQLIIAAFFHDTGLTRTFDASHGKESREICREFLASCSLLPADAFGPVLEAVEKHDDKSYAHGFATGKEIPDDILTLLAASDDLDAFGAIGVFRYLEIYLQRGIPLRSLAPKVNENLGKRFVNLKKHYGALGDFMQEQEKRYRFTVNFYRDLDTVFQSNTVNPADQGPLAIVNLMIEKVLRDRIHLTSLPEHAAILLTDTYGQAYFKALSQEMLMMKEYYAKS